MKLESSNIKFELENSEIVIDVIDAQLKLESFHDSQTQNGAHFAMINGVKEWFRNDFQVELSTSQTWEVIVGVTDAFREIKKKLNLTQESPSGTHATPSDSTVPSYISSTECSEVSSQIGRSTTDKPVQT